MIEKYLPIRGHENYEVSTTGQVRSVSRYITYAYREGTRTIWKAGRVLKFRVNKGGYPYVGLGLGHAGLVKYFTVHRLVATTFLTSFGKEYEVNHKDSDKRNNNVDNLEWVTCSENMLHSYRSGRTVSKGEKHGRSKLTQDQVAEIRASSLKNRKLAILYDVSATHISDIKRKVYW